jgi:hypothetical protein
MESSLEKGQMINNSPQNRSRDSFLFLKTFSNHSWSFLLKWLIFMQMKHISRNKDVYLNISIMLVHSAFLSNGWYSTHSMNNTNVCGTPENTTCSDRVLSIMTMLKLNVEIV